MTSREGVAEDLRQPAPATLWLWPLLATLGIQTTSAFLMRLAPTIAPLLTAATSLPPESIGLLSGFGTLGSIAFLLVGHPLIRRFGPIRVLQVGLVLAGAGVALLTPPAAVALFMANVLIGLGYGPSAPAGSDILLKHAPPHRRTLIFSLKQAGVPLGGVAGGLLLPWLVERMDWRVALCLVAIAPLATVALVQPIRASVDRDRDPTQPVNAGVLLSWTTILAPLRIVLSSAPLRALSVAGCCFAVGQGSLFAFTVTWLVWLGYSLVDAGFIFAAMQATGIGGRVALGWAADRWGSGIRTMLVNALAGAATMALLAGVTAAWPLWVLLTLAGIAGVTVSSWNGVHLAEVARLAPTGRVSEATAGATIVTFVGYVFGPAGFALILATTGSYAAGFSAVAATLLAAFAALLRPARD